MKQLLSLLAVLATVPLAFGQASVTRNGLIVQQASLVFTTPVIGVASGTSLTLLGSSSLLLGTAGSAVGSIGFRNATSGTATLAPPTGALGTYTVTLPNAASTLPIFGQQVTFTGPTAARSYALPNASTTIASAAAALTSTALVTGGGAGLLQTPSATTTLDAGGNFSTPGGISTGVGASTAGVIEFSQGTAPSDGTTSVKLYADTAVTSYKRKLMTSVGVTGYLKVTVSGTTQTESSSATVPASDLSAGTLTADITLGENFGFIYDPALSADGKYSPLEVRAGTAGATLAFGEVVYLAAADSRWELARADSATTSDRLLGICVLAAAADGDPTTIMLRGFIRADAKFPALTIGSPAYISAATAGLITATAPATTGNIVRRVGYAWTADELYFAPSMDTGVAP